MLSGFRIFVFIKICIHVICNFPSKSVGYVLAPCYKIRKTKNNQFTKYFSNNKVQLRIVLITLQAPKRSGFYANISGTQRILSKFIPHREINIFSKIHKLLMYGF